MKDKGLTLIEVLVSMTILAIGLLALLNLHIVSMRGNMLGADMPTAIAIAEDLLNQMRTWDITTGDGTPVDVRFTDSNPANNNSLESIDTINPSAEYSDADLAVNFNGIPTASLPQGYARYWNVASISATTYTGPVVSGAIVAAIVVFSNPGMPALKEAVSLTTTIYFK